MLINFLKASADLLIGALRTQAKLKYEIAGYCHAIFFTVIYKIFTFDIYFISLKQNKPNNFYPQQIL